MTLLGPVFAGLVLLLVGAALGIAPVRKLITVYEARHELRYGAASFLRGLAGWGFVAIWLIAVWFCGTIIGDWGATGDLDGALERSWRRAEILLRIAAAVMDS